MGGTEIFDAAAYELRELSWRWVRTEDHEDFMEPLKRLVAVLEAQDWDNNNESNYWDDPVIGKILGNPELLEEKL